MFRGQRAIAFLLIVMSFFITLSLHPATSSATAGINSNISFTGKLVKSDNTNITDGTYNMEFKVYQDGTNTGSGSTLMWTEDYLVAGSTGMPSTGGVTFASGTFSVNLASICAFTGGTCGAKTNTGVDFNQNTLWLSVQIGNSTSCTVTSSVTSFNTACGGDGEMSPYIRLTAVPYATNANLLDGIDSTALGQLASNQTWTSTNTFQPTTNISSALIKQTSVASPTADIFNIQTANATSLMQFTGPSANTSNVTLQAAGSAGTLTLNASGTGLLTVGNTGTASNIQVGNTTGAVAQTINIGNNATASSSTTITIGNAIGATGLTFNSGTAGATFNQVASGQLLVTSGSNVPSVNQVSISNAGSTGVVTAGVSGLQVSYVGGAAAVEASGVRVNITPGTTTGGTWNGLHIVANSTGAASGVALNGIKLVGPTTVGAGTETGLYIGTGWDTGLDVQSGGLNLAAYTSGGLPADPASPAAGNLRVYAKTVAGRVMLKWKAPSGVDTSLQTSLAFNTINLWTPSLTSTGTGFGTIWPAGTGTFSNVTPTAGAGNQLRRARFTNIVTTTNQILGLTASNTAATNQFWVGSTAGNGGFFMNTRFMTGLVPATTVRLFVGLTSLTTGVAAADTVTLDVAGLSHITTDNITTMAFMTRDNVTTTRAVFTVPTIATGNTYDFTMYCAPNGTTIFYRLVDLLTGTVIVDSSTSTTLPRNTIFMGPQVQMSNGTVNTTATTTAIDINKIYIESDN